MLTPIKFGTDGWRAVVGDTFTPENVARIMHAFADLYPTMPEAGRPVVIGYDCRNQAPETAQMVAELLTARGIDVIVSNTFCPTPAVSWNVVHANGAAGVMVTASHNPPQWNGIKFKESYGGAASSEWLAPIEAQIVKNDASPAKPQPASTRGTRCEFDPAKEYLAQLRTLVDIDAINRAHLNIVYDPMYGAGAGLLGQLVNGITEIHSARDINFGGVHPEPIIPYLQDTMQMLAKGGFAGCMVTDGDADRIGAIDDRGTYVTTHEIFALILKHVVEHRGWTGNVLKSITTTRMIDRLCKRYGSTLTVTPVGFKFISPALKAPGILIGGEESGGIGLPRHICERDGLLSSLLLLEMMATKKQTLGELVKDLQVDVGPSCYTRIDLTLTNEQMATAKARLADFRPESLCGQRVIQIQTFDGFHFLRADDSWLLIRPSGTEPLLRTYAEARTMQDVDTLLAEAQKVIGLKV